MSSTPGPAVALPAAARHLHAPDLFRVLVFGCVVAVHTTARLNPGTNAASNAAVMLLHFTREGFFFLTAFVLFHVYYDRRLDRGKFWRRRFALVGIPYVVWTAIYFAIGQHGHLVPSLASMRELGYDLLTGAAEYHLYFLLVSLQIYLLLPLFLGLVHSTRRFHARLFALCVILQLALFAFVFYAPVPGRSSVAGVLLAHDSAMVVVYPLFLVAGALAAVHLDRFQAWVADNGGLIALFVVAAACLAEATYLLAVHDGKRPALAAAPLQPVLVIWSAAAILGIYALGLAWASHRRDGAVSRAVLIASAASFGVYLVHPAILAGLTNLAPHVWIRLPALSATVLALVATLIVSLVFTEIVHRTPLSPALIGREQLPWPGRLWVRASRVSG